MTMNQFFKALLIGGGISLAIITGTQAFRVEAQEGDPAEVEQSSITYQYRSNSIPLEIKGNAIGVEFTRSRSTDPNKPMPFAELQKDLAENRTRNNNLTVEPIGQYAIVTRSGSRGRGSNVVEKVKQLDYVRTTIPVLSIPESDQLLLLPNEIVINLEPGQNLKSVLDKYDLALIQEVQFVENSYIVRGKNVEGLEVLELANELANKAEIETSAPNFVYQRQVRTPSSFQPQQSTSTTKGQYYDGKPQDYQWYINSQTQNASQARTDVYAPEAWKNSKDGKGVVVAVLDSLIDWEHPDLKKNLYKPKSIEQPLPGEVSGWDFVENDWDTRMSSKEAQVLTTGFRDSFQLSNGELIQKHFTSKCLFTQAITECIRYQLRSFALSEFHGTHSAGVIASRGKKGIIGIAPKAKILPVRVLGFNGGQFNDVADGIVYAALRDADVINMSLGGPIPHPLVDKAINFVTTKFPSVVIVAASGNDNTPFSGYPALHPKVISVGATNVQGDRSYYSNYGAGLDVVAPGGDVSKGYRGGMLTTGGIYRPEFWEGTEIPSKSWSDSTFDHLGKYNLVQGTSFSAPVVSGIIALMKSEDKKRILSREHYTEILKDTATSNTLRRSSQSNSKNYFGAGLVNAEKAVTSIKNRL